MKTILVIDDEVILAEMLQALLEDEGYQVLTARNGREGLERLAEHHPDLILCDVMMPLLDGRELCREVQARPEYDSVPIILMSAASAAGRLDDCRYAAFLSKPFDLDVLLDTINTLLGRPGLASV